MAKWRRSSARRVVAPADTTRRLAWKPLDFPPGERQRCETCGATATHYKPVGDGTFYRHGTASRDGTPFWHEWYWRAAYDERAPTAPPQEEQGA